MTEPMKCVEESNDCAGRVDKYSVNSGYRPSPRCVWHWGMALMKRTMGEDIR